MPRRKTLLTIGDIAAQSGLKADALRYYERLGMIEAPARTAAGYRVYSRRVLERLRFIKQAQQSGLTLAEIRELLGADSWRGAAQCRQVQRVLELKVDDLEARIAVLQRFRNTLKGCLAQCEKALGRKRDADCPVVLTFKRR
jgi:DNA-binding transcriptional MerR regulator